MIVIASIVIVNILGCLKKQDLFLAHMRGPEATCIIYLRRKRRVDMSRVFRHFDIGEFTPMGKREVGSIFIC
jgi:hypothetical protein